MRREVGTSLAAERTCQDRRLMRAVKGAVGGQEFRATRTGARHRDSVGGSPGRRAVRPPYWTNHEALEAKEAPASLTVVGGGATGLELAQAFARFGTAVTIVEAAERMLPAEGPEDRRRHRPAVPYVGPDRITVRAVAARGALPVSAPFPSPSNPYVQSSACWSGSSRSRPLERAELTTSCPCPHGNPMIVTGPRYATGKTSPPPAANTG